MTGRLTIMTGSIDDHRPPTPYITCLFMIEPASRVHTPHPGVSATRCAAVLFPTSRCRLHSAQPVGCISIYLSIYLSIYQSIYLSIHPSIHLSIHPSIYTCVQVERVSALFPARHRVRLRCDICACVCTPNDHTPPRHRLCPGCEELAPSCA